MQSDWRVLLIMTAVCGVTLGPRSVWALPLEVPATSQCDSVLTVKDDFDSLKRLAAVDPREASSRVQNLGLSSDQEFEIAKISAAHHGLYTSQNIRRYNGLNSEQLFEVAKIAADQRRGISPYIREYDRLSSEQIFELAKLAAANDADDVSHHIGDYSRLNTDQLFEVAKVAAANNGRATSASIGRYHGLNTDQLFTVAKIAAAQHGYGPSMYIKNYQGLSTEQLFEIAKIAATHSGHDVSINIHLYEGLSTEQLFEVAKLAVAQNAGGTADNISYYKGLTERQMLQVAKTALMDSRWREIISRYPSQNSVLVRIRPFARIANFDKQTSIEDLKKDLQILFRSKPEKYWNDSQVRKVDERVELEKLLSLAWDRVQRREVGLRLIEEGLKRLSYGKTLPSQSIDFLSFVSGFELRNLPTKTSSDSISDIYELLLDIQKNLSAPFFKSLQWPQDLKSGAQVIGVLTLIRDLKAIKGDSPVAAEDVISILHRSPGTWTESLQSEIVAAFVALLGGVELAGRNDSKSLDFDFQTLNRLQTLWGNLEPVITLASRYQSFGAKKVLLANLKNIFQASLEGKFKQLKFSGVGESEQIAARSQLDMLKPEQVQIWSKPRVLVEPFKASSAKAVDLQEHILNLIRTNLLPHSQDLRLKFSDSIEVSSSTALVNLVSQSKSAPGDLLAEIRSTFGELSASAVFSILLRPFEKDFSQSSRDGLIRLIGFMEYLLRSDGDLSNHQGREDLGADLQSLKSLLKNEVQGTSSDKFLVLTALNSDAKFLLTIGDVVKSGSCQNYRTGGKIEALLGYVLDAHIQGLVSFTLEAQQFDNIQDFNSVYDASAQTEFLPTVEFDGNRRVAIFNLSSGQTISSRPLPHGYLRRMVKLGRTSDLKPALFLEREYVQNHRALAQMRAQVKTVTGNLSHELDADLESQVIEISGSRNACGHYSDALFGAQTKSYKVNRR